GGNPMMRHFHAAAAVLVGSLGVGCSHEQPPPAGPTNFESTVPPAQKGAPIPVDDRPLNDGLTGPAFAPGANGSPVPNGALAANAPDRTSLERQQCSDLARDASMRIEDVSNGVAIIIMPEANVDLTSVRNEVRNIERSMTRLQAGNDAGHTGGGAACALFD